MKKNLLNLALAVAILTMAALLATGCAGNLKVDPVLEAYAESNGQRVAAVGVRGPGIEVDSKGAVIGPQPPKGGVEAVNKHSEKLSDLSGAVKWTGGGLGALLVGLALYFGLRRKKE